MTKSTLTAFFRSCRFVMVAALICMCNGLMAQGINTPPMADGLRSSGKIYVVVVVLLTILAGLFLYLINLDRKISRLEKENSNP